MTQRSIFAGKTPTVIIKSGAKVTVRGYESDRVLAETSSTGGLQVEKRGKAEIGRVRAAIGDFVLFDVPLNLPGLREKNMPAQVIEVQLNSGGEVLVPFKSNLKVYAGTDIVVEGIQGQVDAYAGHKLRLQEVDCLGHASSGKRMEVHCRTMSEKDVKFEAGNDLRFHISDLTSARIRVKDLGGYWEAQIGDGEKLVYLKSGGDVTLITDQKVEPLPPNYILGNVEIPTAPSGSE